MTEKKISRTFRFISGTLALASFTSVLYLFGNAYHEGSLEAFGITPVLFPYQLDRVLFAGYNALLRLWIKGLLPFLGLCASIVAVGGLLHLLSKTKLWQKFMSFIFTDEPVPSSIFDKGFGIATLLFFLYFSALLLVGPSEMAKEIAFNENVKLKNKIDKEIEDKHIVDPQVYVMTYDENGVKTATGILVEASDNVFAMYAPKKTIIIPREKLLSIKSANDILFLSKPN